MFMRWCCEDFCALFTLTIFQISSFFFYEDVWEKRREKESGEDEGRKYVWLMWGMDKKKGDMRVMEGGVLKYVKASAIELRLEVAENKETGGMRE